MRVVVVVALALLVAAPAAAQQVEIEKLAPPPGRREREPAVIAPGLSGEGRPIDADNYPKGGRVPYEPGFIRGLSSARVTPASTGRIGVAGWTAPNTPVGSPVSGWGEINGWFAIGFAGREPAGGARVVAVDVPVGDREPGPPRADRMARPG